MKEKLPKHHDQLDSTPLDEDTVAGKGWDGFSMDSIEVEGLELSGAIETLTEQEKLYTDETVVRQLLMVRELTPGIGEDATSVYLGSAVDTAFAQVYGDQVVHIDKDQSSIAALQALGYLGEAMEYDEYAATLSTDAQIDVVYSHNSGLVPDSILQKIRPGGYVIANNWHGSANDMGAKEDGFSLVGAVSYGDMSIITPERAKAGLGVDELAIVGAKAFTTPEEIARVRDDPSCIVVKDNRNTEAQFVFRKN